MPIITTLIESWELAEASGNALGSHAGLTLTENNGPIAATGGSPSARDFEADNSQYFSRATSSPVQLGDVEVTLEVTVVPETIDGSDRDIISKYETATTDREYRLRLEGSRFTFSVSGDGNNVTDIQNSTAISAGQPYHLIAQHDPTGNTISLIVNNGTPASTAHSTGIYSGGVAPFHIGALGRAAPALYFDGTIMRARLFKSAAGGGGLLTPTQITWLFNSGTTRSYAEIQAEGGGGGGTPFFTTVDARRFRQGRPRPRTATPAELAERRARRLIDLARRAA